MYFLHASEGGGGKGGGGGGLRAKGFRVLVFLCWRRGGGLFKLYMGFRFWFFTSSALGFKRPEDHAKVKA